MAEVAHPKDTRRASGLLAVGAAIGLGIAAIHLLAAPSPGDEIPAGVVARVEGAMIRDETYLRLVAALASDRRAPLTHADRARVLDRLIEEELLVQHAVALGLIQTDRRVRADLVTAVLGAINAGADTYEPTPKQVEDFYAENLDYFARPARVHARRVFVARGKNTEAALTRATRAANRLRDGESFDAVREALGDEVVAPVPNAPLPPAKLREYLGPTALDAALRMSAGDVSDPIDTPQGFHVLLMVARSDAQAQPIAAVRSQVVNEIKRREGDRRLRERLDELRDDADVVVAPELPASP